MMRNLALKVAGIVRKFREDHKIKYQSREGLLELNLYIRTPNSMNYLNLKI